MIKGDDETVKRDLKKVTVVSALSIGILGASFVGINQLVLANTLNHVETIPSGSAEATETLQEQNSDAFDLKVIERALNEGASEELELFFNYFSFDVPENALTPEEAAQLGAQYIYDMFGENIEGQIVEISFHDFEFLSRIYWQGRVASSEADFENREHDFEFLVDAITGERISIDNHRGREINLDFSFDWENQEIPTLDNLESYKKIVKEFAKNHFIDTEIANIDVEFFMVDFIDWRRNEEGELVVEWIGRFNVTDETGRLANVGVTLDTQQLRFFSTTGSDRIITEGDNDNQRPIDENAQYEEWTLPSGERILIVDNTHLAAELNPHMDHELTSHNLSIEEAAEIGARLIYDEFGESVDEMRFEKIFWHILNGGREFWNGTVYDEEGNALFYYLIDARTGEKIELSMNTAETPFLG